MSETIDLDSLIEAEHEEWQREHERLYPPEEAAPPKRTKSYKPIGWHHKQRRYLESTARFNVTPAGRRGGKTLAGKRRLVKKAMRECRHENAWFVACAPTNGQAKRIYWRDLKALVPRSCMRGGPSEGEMLIPLTNGADIQVFGMDVPERIEGKGPLMHILIDEYGNMKKRVWSEHIRPALIETGGSADLIGVPEGRNHYYDTYKDCLADITGQWQANTWTTEEVLPLYIGEEKAALEIAQAKKDMDLLTYQQEFQASFVSFSGRAYYTFDAAIHSPKNRVLPWIKKDDLNLCFDFNVAPGVALAVQEHRINPYGILDLLALQRTCVIGEVYIPQNSNTPAVCRKIIEQWGTHEGQVNCYGDQTGGRRQSSQTQGSDWDLIRQVLGKHFGDRLNFCVPNENPFERDRVNSVNSRFRSVDGTIGTFVDPRCKWFIKDCEGVPLLEGGSGEIDKNKDKKLTHITDAYGYYVDKEHPVRKNATEVDQY